MPLSELPDPNNFFLGNQFFSLSSVSDGGRNVYTTDNIRAGNKTQNVTIGYVVAMRAANKVKEDQKRICFIYMKSDSQDQWGSQYSWTVDKTACLRNIRSAYIFYWSKIFDNLLKIIWQLVFTLQTRVWSQTKVQHNNLRNLWISSALHCLLDIFIMFLESFLHKAQILSVIQI